MSIVRSVLIALGSTLSLLLIFVGTVGYLLTGPAPVPWSTTPDPWNWYDARAFDEKTEDFHQQIVAGSAGDSVALELCEDEVNSRLNELASQQRLPLKTRDVRVHFDDGVIRASATVDLIIDVQVAAEVRVAIKDERPVMAVENLHLGRLPIPKTLIGNVVGALMSQTDARLEGLPIRLTEVVVGEGCIIISGEVKEPPSEA